MATGNGTSDEAAIRLVMRAQVDDFFSGHDDDPLISTLERARNDAKIVSRKYNYTITAFNFPSRELKEDLLAKPNYQFEKRQRDLAKKRKQEEKQRQKLANKAPAEGQDTAATNPTGTAPPDADSTVVSPPDGATKPEA